MWSGRGGTSRRSGTATITLSLRNLAATNKERRAAMGGRCPVVSAVGRTGVEEHVVEVQWNTRKRCFSTNLSSPHGPKETELVVLVRPAPDSRKSPTAIGSGALQEEELNSTTTPSERRATREAQRPRCGVGDLWSAITDLRTRLSSLWRGLQGVAGGSVSNPHVMGGGGLFIFDGEQHHFNTISRPPPSPLSGDWSF